MRDTKLFALFCMQSTLTNLDHFTHGWDFNTGHAIGFYTALEVAIDFRTDYHICIGELVSEFAIAMAKYLPLDEDLDHVKIATEWLHDKGFLKKYEWVCSCGSVYGKWDCGEVYATTPDRAYKLAQEAFVANVEYINRKLGETVLEISSNDPKVSEIK